METFLGTICAFGFNFAPYQWALCSGNILPIQQYTALFSLLGVQYGGNGTNTFGLPNLQGRAAIGQGTLTDSNGVVTEYEMGQSGGSDTTSIIAANFAPHSHQVTLTLNANTAIPGTASAGNNYPAQSPPGGRGAPADDLYAAAATSSVFMANPTVSLAPTGTGGAVVSVCSPYLTMNYCIALSGYFPSRQ